MIAGENRSIPSFLSLREDSDMLLAQSDFIELLQQIDEDLLGVVFIIGTIGIFLTMIVTIVTVARTINSLLLTRMQHTMVKNLLAQGYSVQEVERLAYGNHRWGDRFRHFFDSARQKVHRLKKRGPAVNQPVPPLKQTI
jgi:hypothetical protein